MAEMAMIPVSSPTGRAALAPLAAFRRPLQNDDMSIAAPQADAFFKEVIITGEVWAIRDQVGFPTATNASGETAMPFWSKESRASAVIENVQAYRDFRTESLPLSKFIQNWLPGLKRDGLFVGVNWSGERALGYDMNPSEVLDRLAAMGCNGS